jgi:hypothetical protein
MTEEQVRNLLARAVDEAGGQRAFGRKHKISAAYVGLVLNGGDEPQAQPRPSPGSCRPGEDQASRTDLATFRQAENKPEVVKPPTEGKAN